MLPQKYPKIDPANMIMPIIFNNCGKSSGKILNVPLKIPLIDGVVATLSKFSNDAILLSETKDTTKETGLIMMNIFFFYTQIGNELA